MHCQFTASWRIPRFPQRLAIIARAVPIGGQRNKSYQQVSALSTNQHRVEMPYQTRVSHLVPTNGCRRTMQPATSTPYDMPGRFQRRRLPGTNYPSSGCLSRGTPARPMIPRGKSQSWLGWSYRCGQIFSCLLIRLQLRIRVQQALLATESPTNAGICPQNTCTFDSVGGGRSGVPTLRSRPQHGGPAADCRRAPWLL